MDYNEKIPGHNNPSVKMPTAKDIKEELNKRLHCGLCGDKIQLNDGHDCVDTKTEPTNEQIAEALGWERRWENMEVKWLRFKPFIDSSPIETPDFKNDLNASREYVWPALKQNYQVQGGCYSLTKMGELWALAVESTNPALYLATEFWKLKKGE